MFIPDAKLDSPLPQFEKHYIEASGASFDSIAVGSLPSSVPFISVEADEHLFIWGITADIIPIGTSTANNFYFGELVLSYTDGVQVDVWTMLAATGEYRASSTGGYNSGEYASHASWMLPMPIKLPKGVVLGLNLWHVAAGGQMTARVVLYYTKFAQISNTHVTDMFRG